MFTIIDVTESHKSGDYLQNDFTATSRLINLIARKQNVIPQTVLRDYNNFHLKN